ncbi:dienelactone hydrolase family protein [Nocardia sp. R6R-6]|uniref:dienelactone hydrolase family protein n=1 Tax=Nocardia sp. R6R-6 TaxID=3459303 RepID=UPI00403DE025
MAQTITIPTADGHQANAYLAAAATDSRAGVVVIHEIAGLTAHFGALCERFAENGYSAIAPDLFSRDPGIVEPVGAGDFGAALARFYALGSERWLGDLAAAREALVARCGVDPDRVAVLGFCLGGYLSLLAATDPSGGWAAAAPFYGPPAGYGNFGAPAEPNPLARARNLSCPARLFYGKHDEHIPAEDALAFAADAQAAGGHVEVVLEDAGHAFFNDTRDSYDEVAAEHAWTALLEFLGNTLEEAR